MIFSRLFSSFNTDQQKHTAASSSIPQPTSTSTVVVWCLSQLIHHIMLCRLGIRDLEEGRGCGHSLTLVPRHLSTLLHFVWLIDGLKHHFVDFVDGVKICTLCVFLNVRLCVCVFASQISSTLLFCSFLVCYFSCDFLCHWKPQVYLFCKFVCRGSNKNLFCVLSI